MSDPSKSTTPARNEAAVLASSYGLENHGLTHLGTVYWNLPDAPLYEEAVFRGEGRLAREGAIIVHTGKHTARAAADKYIVKEGTNEDKIWWGAYNRPFSQEQFNVLMQRAQAYCQGRDVFVQDCHAGADPDYQLGVRVITENAWHSLFARNMFLTIADQTVLKDFMPDFTIVALPGFRVDPKIDGTRSETAIVLNFERRIAVMQSSIFR